MHLAFPRVQLRPADIFQPTPEPGGWRGLWLAALLAGAMSGAAKDSDGANAQSGRAVVVDLRPELERLGLTPRRQGDRPTCSAFVVTGALEFAAARATGRGTRLSVEFLNWASNQAVGEARDGGFFSDLWKGFAAHGVCSEHAMPSATKFDPARSPTAEAMADAKTRLGLALRWRWIKEWDVKTGLTEAHLGAIQRALREGWPVCAGLRWPKQEKWVDGVLQMCPPEAVFDGHSVLLVGYREDATQPGGGVLLFRNSGGNGRDGCLPYAYARAYMNDAAWVDAASPGYSSPSR